MRHALLVAYLALAALSLTGVLFRDLATADGLVLGLPVGLAWVTLWAVATPFALWVYERAAQRGRES